MDELHPDKLRFLFYAVTPNETTFASVDDVPDYNKVTMAWMVVLLMLEFAILDKSKWALNDTVTSMTSGLLYILMKFSGRYISANIYIRLYPIIHLVDLDATSPWTWLLCFFTQDFVYYLAHRAMHECAIFWAFHQAHHSSEYYNLSTAFRKGVVLEIGATFFDCLQAFFIPPVVFMPHKSLNLLYQFWLHTELIPPLGPLEYVLNTPSSHRVHHGRNPYCIDRNYGGTLIIWDRLFGTYAAEQTGTPISYGLVTNIRSFNQLWLQWFDFQVYGVEKGLMTDPDGKEYFPGLWQKLVVPFLPPGYFPGVPIKRFFWWWHLEDNTLGIPEVDPNEPRYNPPISAAKSAYLIGQLLFLAGFALHFNDTRSVLGWPQFVSQLIVILATIQMFGYYFDKNPQAPFHDRMRCFGLLAYTLHAHNAVLAMVAIFSLPCIYFFEYEQQMEDEEAKQAALKDNSAERKEKVKTSDRKKKKEQ